MTCPACGDEVSEGDAYCGHCGTRIWDEDVVLERADELKSAQAAGGTAPNPARPSLLRLHRWKLAALGVVVLAGAIAISATSRGGRPSGAQPSAPGPAESLSPPPPVSLSPHDQCEVIAIGWLAELDQGVVTVYDVSASIGDNLMAAFIIGAYYMDVSGRKYFAPDFAYRRAVDYIDQACYEAAYQQAAQGLGLG